MGSLLFRVERGEIEVLGVGTDAEVGQHPGAKAAAAIDAAGYLAVPALVNAHTHLDLTHIGPLALSERGFSGFVDVVRAGRRTESEGIRDSVRQGAALSRAGGVAAVGDIGGAVKGGASTEPFAALAEAGLRGVSFVEFFAMGMGEERSLQRLDEVIDSVRGLETSRLKPGIQPHAPYSVSPAGYRHAMRLASIDELPMATHLAESMEEREFIGGATGAQRKLLETLGLWNDSLLSEFGRGLSATAHLAHVVKDAPRKLSLLLVHLNDLSDADIVLLDELNGFVNLSVAYCPRASSYFGAPGAFGEHRYRELLRLGINVCLGTDSIINLPMEQATGDAARISPLDDARLLFERDGTDAMVLLEMLTTRGARALAMEEGLFTLMRGEKIAGICLLELGDDRSGGAREMWKRALRRKERPRLLDAADK